MRPHENATDFVKIYMRYCCSTVAAIVFSAAVFSATGAEALQSLWTLAVIGDQQVPVENPQWLDRFTSQTSWMAANAASINLRMVTQIGDIVEHGDNLAEWNRALPAMQVLDTAPNADGGVGIPWSVSYGNHEIIGAVRNSTTDPAGLIPSANYRQYFGSASGTHRYANQPEFQGVSSNDLNTWHIIHSSDAPDSRPYLMLNLEIDVPGQKAGTNFDAIQWAQGLIDAHPGMATIVSTHVFEGSAFGPPNNPYLFGFGHNSQLEIFDKLVKNNSQIFMVLSGHTSEDTHQIKLNAYGQPVLQMVTDYGKWLGTAGDGFFRQIQIDEIAGEVRVKTYSALLDQYRTNANGQFTWAFNFANRFDTAPDPDPCPCAPPDGGLVGHWRLDDGLSNPNSLTATDSASSPANGAWQNVTAPRWTTGVAGGAAQFGGSASSADRDDVIAMPAEAEGNKLDITGALTLSAWIKYDEHGSPASTRHIAGKDRSGGADQDSYSLKHQMTSGSGNNTLQFLIASGGVNTNLVSSKLLPAYTAASQNGGWIQVAGVFEPGEFMRLYIDGVLDAELTGASVPSSVDFYPQTPFTIGRLHNSNQHSFNGGIDDVQLYDSALSSEQIAFLFQHPGEAVVTDTMLDGDYNNDGTVDDADYTVWRNNFGNAAALPNDGGIGGPVGTSQYLLWRKNVGHKILATQVAIPEPSAIALVSVALVGLTLRKTRAAESESKVL